MRFRHVLRLSLYLVILSCFLVADDPNSKQAVSNGFENATGRFWWKSSDRLSKSSQITNLYVDLLNNSAPRETGLICIAKQRPLLATASGNNGFDGRIIQPNYSSGEKTTRFDLSYLEVSGLFQAVLPKNIARIRALSLSMYKTILFRIHATWNYFHREPKRSRGMCLYYPNSCAARQILLKSGDISLNPGPPLKQQQVRPTTRRKLAAPHCTQCEKPVARNHKRCICTVCLDLTHVKCTNTFNPKRASSIAPVEWVCPKCTISRYVDKNFKGNKTPIE